MRLLSKIALGGGITSAATAGTLVALGVFATSATLVAADPVAPAAHAGPDALKAFGSCAEVLSWYVENGVKDVGPYGWDNGVIAFAEDGVGRLDPAPRALNEASGTLDTALTSSGTGTNTQEAAVDEPDVAKTNGDLVVRITGERRLSVVDVPVTKEENIGGLRLPWGGVGTELLLVGDHVIITQQAGDRSRIFYGGLDKRFAPNYGEHAAVRILDVDIADPAAPKLVRKDVYGGSLVSARQYGSTVRLVTTTPRPELDWVTPGKGTSEQEAIRRNKALVRSTSIEDWLPRVRGYAASSTLPDCDEVYHPRTWSGADTVAVTTYDTTDPAARSTLAVTASGQIVYSSGDRLYVASTELDRRAIKGPRGFEDRAIVGWGATTTYLHAFALEDGGTSYAGSGHVDGRLRDRWSLDEHDGRLRVAWSKNDQRGRSTNGITVLTERDGRLEPTGTLTGLGDDEDIQAVRWFDDLAIVVTFRQTDPLYTIDLSDQDHPRTSGVLKIPGFSRYLHPIGDHLLLGLGMEVGAQAAVFDISDLHHPVRISLAKLGADAELPALSDPRAFTWLDDRRTGLTPVAAWGRSYDGPRQRLVALKVSKTGQLEAVKLADLGGDQQVRTLALPDGRVAVIDDDGVRLLTIR